MGGTDSSSPTTAVESAVSEAAVLQALDTAAAHNCIFLVKEDTPSPLHGPVRSRLAVHLLETLLGCAPLSRSPGSRHGLIACSSHAETAALANMLRQDPQVSAACQLVLCEGSADLLAIRETIRSSWSLTQQQVLLTSSNNLLYLFVSGLVVMEDFDFIIFDNITPANRFHPYCLFLQSFYCPLLVQRYWRQQRGEFTLVPRLISFADWPRNTTNLAFHLKLKRDRKFFQYHRLFHSTIVPLRLAGSPSSAPINWMPESDLDELFPPVDSVFSNLTVTITDDLAGALQQQLGRCCLPEQDSRVVVFADPALSRVHLQGYPVEDGYEAFDPDETMSIVIVGENPNLPLETILTSHVTSISVIAHQESLGLVAGLMACRAGLLALQTPREAEKLFTNFESFHLNADYLREQGPLHWRPPQSRSLMLHSISAGLFLAICACLPRDASLAPHKINTVAVRRVLDDDTPLDGERYYYLTRIKLPAILTSALHFVPPFPADQLIVVGQLTASRIGSLNSAAFRAIKAMHEHGMLDGNLIPRTATEGGSRQALNLDTDIRRLVEEGGDLDEDEELLSFNVKGPSRPSVNVLEINELVPDEMQFGPQWAGLRAQAASGAVQTFTMLVFEYSTVPTKRNLSPPPVGVEGSSGGGPFLPCDSRIHLEDLDYFSSDRSGRTLALLFPQRSPEQYNLKQICINMGSYLGLEGQLRCIQDTSMSEEQVEKLLEFQVFLFTALNTRPAFTIEPPPSASDLASLPDEKKLTFLAAIVRNADSCPPLANPLNLDDALERYHSFVQNPKLPTSTLTESAANSAGQDEHGEHGENDDLNAQQSRPVLEYKPKSSSPQRWTIDWALIDRALDQDSYMRLSQFAESLDQMVARSTLPAAPSFISSPEKPPTVVDFRLFALRRLIVFTPHTGIIYRLKKWLDDLTPSSPFTSKSVPECATYADYYRLRYGLQVEDPHRPGLVQAKRVENFIRLPKWVSKESSSSKKIRSGDKSVVLPELALVLPLPYAVLRLAMMAPRLVYDVEHQLLAIQCLRDQLGPLQSLWPPTSVMVEALTGAVAGAGYDYERLEIFGDTLLKYFTTVDAFLANRLSSEGQLTRIRETKIKNLNLLSICNERKIPRYARLTNFLAKLFTPPAITSLLDMKRVKAKWPLAPYLMDDGIYRWQCLCDLEARTDRRLTLYNIYPNGRLKVTDLKAQDSVQRRHRKVKSEMTVTTKYGFQIPPKTMADMMEALLAAFYVGGGGVRGALEFLIFLGICSESMRSLAGLSSHEVVEIARTWFKDTPEGADEMAFRLGVAQAGAALIYPPPYIPDEESFPYEAVEERLGYRFVTRRLLFLACTHISVDPSHSYERLEWLGDAALDWIVTRYYWENFDDHRWMTPRRITDARGAAVCNEAYARLAVNVGLHPYLRINSQALQQDIETFVEDYARNPFSLHGETMQAPKALGDLFESVAGAIILDLCFDIERFEQIMMVHVRPFLQARADPYDLPDQPVNDFWHSIRISGLVSQVELQYEPTEIVIGEPSLCRVLIRGQCAAEAMGSTRFQARINACRAAARNLQSDGWRDYTRSR